MPTATVTPIVPPRARELADKCRRLALERLGGILNDVLVRADDVLFDVANTADNSRRQNLYFDAMRELRLNRGEIGRTFNEQLARGFAEALAPAAARQIRGGGLELSLVGLDEVEETLAIGQFADSVKGRCGPLLHALEQRIGALLRQPRPDGDSNPVGPKAIGHALRIACESFETGIEVKLTLYKLFDKFAGYPLQQLYGELNDLLLQAGVLPDLGTTGATRPAAPARRTRVIIESGEASAEASGEDVFSTLQQLLGAQGGLALTGGTATGGAGSTAGGVRFGAGIGAGGSGAGPTAPGAGLPGGSGITGGGVAGFPSLDAASGGFPPLLGAAVDGGGYVAMPVLIENLTGLQRGVAGGAGLSAGMTAPGIAGNVTAGATVNLLRDLRGQEVLGPLAPTEDMTLEIVSLLFDYILEDASIPDALKALIGRLQIPVLKVALLDRGVFSRKTHPARRLLDTLARAAVGYSSARAGSEALYEQVERAVRRIVNEFEDDVGLFEEVLADFEAFLAAATAAAAARSAAATRSLNTREQVVLARFAVDEALGERLRGREVREFVRQFLFDYWRQLLIVTWVEEGAGSATWTGQLSAVDELLWSIEPKATPEDRRALSARLPALIKDIKRGMVALEMAPADCSRFLSMLASVHVVSIKQIEESSLAARKLARNETAVPGTEARVVTAEDFADPGSEAFIKAGLERIFERKADGEALELDIDFSAFEPAAPTDAEEDIEPELAAYVERVTTLDLGDWVEFECEDGSRVRGRFTWISPTTGRYLFTGQDGEVVLDSSFVDLAREFRDGNATIIRAETDPLLDRALGALIEKLEAQAA